MKNKDFKFWILVSLLVVVVIGVGWWSFVAYRQANIYRRFVTGGEQALTPTEYAVWLPKILEKKYRADTYGSSTPEGTLALFIEALKKGDAELASKYFVPESQTKERIEMQRSLLNDKDSFSDLISFYGTTKKSVSYYDNGTGVKNIAEVHFPSKNSGYPYFFRFYLNSINNIWKLESI